MYFETFADFLAMGGHGLYVWLAYGATALIWIGYPLALYLLRRRSVRRLQWMINAATLEDKANSDQNSAP